MYQQALAILTYLLRTVVLSSLSVSLQIFRGHKQPSGCATKACKLSPAQVATCAMKPALKRKASCTLQRDMCKKRCTQGLHQQHDDTCPAAVTGNSSSQHDVQVSRCRKRGAPDADMHSAADPETRHVQKRRTTANKHVAYETCFHVGYEDAEEYRVFYCQNEGWKILTQNIDEESTEAKPWWLGREDQLAECCVHKLYSGGSC